MIHSHTSGLLGCDGIPGEESDAQGAQGRKQGGAGEIARPGRVSSRSSLREDHLEAQRCPVDPHAVSTWGYHCLPWMDVTVFLKFP